jgi:uncharacterized membrane-anchored protein
MNVPDLELADRIDAEYWNKTNAEAFLDGVLVFGGIVTVVCLLYIFITLPQVLFLFLLVLSPVIVGGTIGILFNKFKRKKSIKS